MNADEVTQPAVTTARRSFFYTPLGAVVGAVFGALIGIALSKILWLGERTQQMNLTNTGASAMLVKIDTKRFGGDGEVLIEPGKDGRFIYGEGDELTIFPGTQASDKAHSVILTRKAVLAEANADDKESIKFQYKCE
jgi:hypothetical protein